MPDFAWVAVELDFVLIDKFPGVGFHREGDEAGIMEKVMAALGEGELYPVHRLDRMTSGLLLFARNLDTARVLNQQFAARQISKYYLAISDKKPKKKQGRVSGDMEKGRRGSWRLLPSRQHPAVTDFISTALGAGERLYLLRPLTGRTHQLRVALKSLGAPIVGDDRYYPANGASSVSADRGYLHAYGLRFLLGDQAWQFVCPPRLGQRFLQATTQQAIAEWSDPWVVMAKPTRPEW